MNKKKQNYLPAGRQERFLRSVFGMGIIKSTTNNIDNLNPLYAGKIEAVELAK